MASATNSNDIPQLVIPELGPSDRLEDWCLLFKAAVTGLLGTPGGQRRAIGLLPRYLNRSIAERELAKEIVTDCKKLEEALALIVSLDPPLKKSDALQRLCRIDWKAGTTVDDFFYELKKWSKLAGTDNRFVCQLFVSQLPSTVQDKVQAKIANWEEDATVSNADAREILSFTKNTLSSRGISQTIGSRDFDRMTSAVSAISLTPTLAIPQDDEALPFENSVNYVKHQQSYPNRGRGGHRGRGAGRDSRFYNPHSNPTQYQPHRSSECHICGSTEHFMRSCPTRKCARCGKVGHDLFQCPVPRDDHRGGGAAGGSSRGGFAQRGGGMSGKVNRVDIDSSSSHKSERIANKYDDEAAAMIRAVVNGVPVTALVDTGAGPSVMSKSIHAKIGSPPLCSTTSKVQTIGKSRVTVLGKVTVPFEVDGEFVEHSFSVLEIPDDTLIMSRRLQGQYGSTEFDWENCRIRLGVHWVPTELIVRGGSQDSRVHVVADCVGDRIERKKPIDTETQFDINPKLCHDEKRAILELLTEFADVFAVDPNRPSLTHLITHDIDTGDAPPFKQKVSRMSPQKEAEVNAQIDRMLANGIIKPSSSPWSSRVLLVKKKDGTYRFVVDFRALNDLTKKDSYPMPKVHDVIDRMGGSTVFSTMDGASAYWTIPLSERSKEKTAFSVPRGQFELEVCSFGMCNAQADYQRLHDEVLFPAQRTCAYVDDSCTFSRTFREHLRDLRVALQCYRSASMQLKRSKCHFGYGTVDFVGYQVSAEGFRPLPEYTKAVSAFPTPINVKEVQRFLGMINYHRHFLKNMAEIARPLYALTKKGTPFEWSTTQQDAFESLKAALVNAPVLNFIQWDKPFVLESDASRVAVGAVLSQHDELGRLRPVAYFSSGLTETQRNYSATELECWGLIACTRKFRVYVESAVELVLVTDHNPLVWLRNQTDPRGKFARWTMELEELNYKVVYRRGSDNAAADCLSRCDVPVDPEVQDDEKFFDSKLYRIVGNDELIEKLRVQQDSDYAIDDAKQQLEKDGAVSRGKFRNWDRLSLDDHILLRGRKIVLPDSMRREVVTAVHASKHGGVKATTQDVSTNYCGTGLQGVIDAVVSSCEICQRNKRSYDLKVPMEIFSSDYSKCRMAVAFDVATLPWSDDKYRYFLVIVDLFARYVELVPMKDQKGPTVATAFYEGWILKHGVPVALLSDQGPSMDRDVIRDLCAKYNIKKLHSSPHHPEGDGLAENTVQAAKLKLRCLLEERKIPSYKWPSLLLEVTFALNSKVNTSTKVSPHELYFGDVLRHPVLTSDLAVSTSGSSESPEEAAANVRNRITKLTDQVQTNQLAARVTMKRFYDRKTRHRDIGVGDLVLVDNRYRRSGLDPTFTGPFEVRSRNGPTVTLEGKRGPKTIHLNRCKKFRIADHGYPIPILANDEVWTDDTPSDDAPRRSPRLNVDNN